MKPRVLVVEDEAIAALAIRMMLESMGCSVSGIADNGEQAIGLVSASCPDLVLMDIRLKGGMSGIDCARQIQARWRIPVIFTTAYSADEIRRTCDMDDASLFLTKPIQEQELARAVASLCSRFTPGAPG
jgi:CheY-like chemotaxis protein